SLYDGERTVTSLQLIHEAPQEVGTRPVPMWQVAFDDFGETTLYLSPSTGELLATRHSLWRWVGFLWMLHIMDYGDRADVNNTLLRIASSLGLAFAVRG